MAVNWKQWQGAEIVVGRGNTPKSRGFLKNTSALKSLVLSMNTTLHE